MSPCFIFFLVLITNWNYLVYWLVDLYIVIFPHPFKNELEPHLLLALFLMVSSGPQNVRHTEDFQYLSKIEWDIVELNFRKKICNEWFLDYKGEWIEFPLPSLNIKNKSDWYLGPTLLFSPWGFLSRLILKFLVVFYKNIMKVKFLMYIVF